LAGYAPPAARSSPVDAGFRRVSSLAHLERPFHGAGRGDRDEHLAGGGVKRPVCTNGGRLRGSRGDEGPLFNASMPAVDPMYKVPSAPIVGEPPPGTAYFLVPWEQMRRLCPRGTRHTPCRRRRRSECRRASSPWAGHMGPSRRTRNDHFWLPSGASAQRYSPCLKYTVPSGPTAGDASTEAVVGNDHFVVPLVATAERVVPTPTYTVPSTPIAGDERTAGRGVYPLTERPGPSFESDPEESFRAPSLLFVGGTSP
jgi:hypothetical protein